MDGLVGGQAFRLDMESVKYGMIQTFKTGNVVLDTLLCCLVPLIVSLVFANLVHVKTWWDNTGYPFLLHLIFGNSKKPLKPEFTRTLVNRRTQNYFHGSQQDKTRQLMTAISLYIKTLNKSFLQADVSLVDVEEKDNYYYYSSQDSNRDQFKNQEILWQPQNGLWIEVDDGVLFMRNDEVVEAGEKEGAAAKNMVTFAFKSTEDDGDKRIDAFLKKAYDWYKADITSRKDNTRYYYSYTAADSAAGEAGSTIKYKRFALSDEKDFDAIFFPGKKELMTLLENFKNKSGRYAIKGSAHKLGMLLHGPPGTGKTSFIKAIARHFNRHIVSIPLARIETNEELLDLMFDLNFKIHGIDYPVKYTYADCIFVFEDVDAASDVVQKRAGDSGPRTTTVKITKEVTIKNGGDTSNVLGSGVIALGGSMSSPIEKEPSIESTTIVREVSKGGGRDDSASDADLVDRVMGDDSDDEGLMSKKDGRKKSGPSSKWYERKDKLNLAGLLEVLDGVVDCPNRLIVMTSNHPEVLDPALTRPGRIDKKIKLDYLAAPEAIEMTEHFLGPMNDKQRERMTAVLEEQRLSSKVVTPAILEQACAEYDQPDTLVEALHAMVRAAAAATKHV